MVVEDENNDSVTQFTCFKAKAVHFHSLNNTVNTKLKHSLYVVPQGAWLLHTSSCISQLLYSLSVVVCFCLNVIIVFPWIFFSLILISSHLQMKINWRQGNIQILFIIINWFLDVSLVQEDVVKHCELLHIPGFSHIVASYFSRIPSRLRVGQSPPPTFVWLSRQEMLIISK